MFSRRPKDPLLRTVRSADELQLANVSAVDDFALEARHMGEALLAFACDETDGTIQVFFGPTPENL